MKIPFYSLTETHEPIKESILSGIRSVVESGKFILGDKLKVFEDNFSSYIGMKYCAGVGSGLDAITISLLALGIKIGDEVIVPAHTFIATIQAVINTGATPVLVDADYDTFNIDPNKIEEKITDKTKAIIPVHMYGNPCKMNEILHIAKKYNLYLVEDFAQAVGAVYNNMKVGSIGIINATSFYPTKNLGAMGDGGGVMTDSNELNKKVRSIRNYGSQVKYIHEEEGMNSRLDEIQAAILDVKLQYLNRWNEERNFLAAIYDRCLSEIEGVELPLGEINAVRAYHIYVIKTQKRDQLKQFLQEKGIDTMIHYPVSAHLQKSFASLGHYKGSFPVCEKISHTCLSLPLYNGMGEEKIDYVARQIKEFFIR